MKPHGFIYKAVNQINGKIYIGQTINSRWNYDEDPVEARWCEEVYDAFRLKRIGEKLRYIENAILKYGPENFLVYQIDIAYDQNELDEKEKKWIKKFKSLNKKYGYNLTEGGRGGKLNIESRKKISKKMRQKWKDFNYRVAICRAIIKKWQDKKYYEKQIKTRSTKEYLKKLRLAGIERNQDPDFKERIREKILNLWQNNEFREKQRIGMKKKWQDEDFKEKQFQERKERSKNPNFLKKMRNIANERKKKINNKIEFLIDIRNKKKKEIMNKYRMGGATVNRRINEILGTYGIKNFREAKLYLNRLDIKEIIEYNRNE